MIEIVRDRDRDRQKNKMNAQLVMTHEVDITNMSPSLP